MTASGTDQAAAARQGRSDWRVWFARAAVAAVFAVNVECALAFLARPGLYASGFELGGVPGDTAVRALGLAFLMWNATYPPVIWRPARYRELFGVVLAQQAIGLLGESWLLLTLPAGHEAIASSIARFAVFDGVGLALLAAAFALTRSRRQRG